MFLCLLCHLFFVLDCLSLYFSDPFPFESFKTLFLPNESFQFSAMRFFPLLFFLRHVMFIKRLTPSCCGSEGSSTFSLSHFYFVLVSVGLLLLSFLMACSPTLFWYVLFSDISFLGGFSLLFFLCDNIRNHCYQVLSKNFKSSVPLSEHVY